MWNVRSEVSTAVNRTLLMRRRVVCEECTWYVSEVYVVFIFKLGIFLPCTWWKSVSPKRGYTPSTLYVITPDKKHFMPRIFSCRCFFVNIITRSLLFQEILNTFCETVSYIGHKLFGIMFKGNILRRVENKKKMILPRCCLCVSLHRFLTCWQLEIVFSWESHPFTASSPFPVSTPRHFDSFIPLLFQLELFTLKISNSGYIPFHDSLP